MPFNAKTFVQAITITSGKVGINKTGLYKRITDILRQLSEPRLRQPAGVEKFNSFRKGYSCLVDEKIRSQETEERETSTR